MISLARRCLSPAEAGPALRALSEWTPADAPVGGLHPGDVGWHLWRDNATVLLWTDGEVPVAVGFLDHQVLRANAPPRTHLDAPAAEGPAPAQTGHYPLDR